MVQIGGETDSEAKHLEKFEHNQSKTEEYDTSSFFSVIAVSIGVKVLKQ